VVALCVFHPCPRSGAGHSWPGEFQYGQELMLRHAGVRTATESVATYAYCQYQSANQGSKLLPTNEKQALPPDQKRQHPFSEFKIPARLALRTP
jgi:hypothetical protein